MKYWYSAAVLALTIIVSLSIRNFFGPILLEAGKLVSISDQLSIVGFIWQFLLLGVVVGGVIFTIPVDKGNRDRFRLAGMLSVLGSFLMIGSFGFGVLAKAKGVDSFIVLTSIQIGLTIFYIGMAIAFLELVLETYKTTRNFFR